MTAARILLVVALVLAIPGAILVGISYAAVWRGPYRRDEDLRDTRPRRPT